MEFDKSRVYTAVNADELKPGDKVIVGDSLQVLKQGVANPARAVVELVKVGAADWECRFLIREVDCETGYNGFQLAYLVERKENCTNCVHRESERCKPLVSPINCCPCYDKEVKQSVKEKHFRPFKDTECLAGLRSLQENMWS